MYDTKEQLLAVKDPDAIDALAQRAVKLIDKFHILANYARAIDPESDESEVLVAMYFTAWAPLLSLHEIRPYAFVQRAKDNVPAEHDDSNLFQLLPVMVRNLSQEEAAEEIAKCEENCALWNEQIKKPVLN